MIKVGRFMRALQSGRFCGNPGGTAIDRPGGSSYREPPGFIVAGGTGTGTENGNGKKHGSAGSGM